jgi:hypothetical protein
MFNTCKLLVKQDESNGELEVVRQGECSPIWDQLTVVLPMIFETCLFKDNLYVTLLPEVLKKRMRFRLSFLHLLCFSFSSLCTNSSFFALPVA